ncbi:RHS repeat-associated core domain-containing protein, partial [Escherichia marmotae]
QESRPEGISRLYIYSDQGSYEPLARVDKAGKEGPNRILYFHTDVNGAPEEMTDSDGKIVWETGYQVWGNTIQEKDHGRVEQNLRYQGQYLDRETGLHYNLHRYYDPDVGRFIVTDPIGLAGGLNLYAYAPNPLGWIDPLGLSAASDLPQLKGRSPGAIGSILTDNGFNLDKQTSTGNQTWSHADGSKVRVDPYGNQSMTMKNGDPLPKSGANAHVHKYDPGEVPLNDRGIPSTNPNETHIGIRNPNDYPTKRGRAHGCGA